MLARGLLSLLIAVPLLASAHDPLSIGGEWLINGYKTVLSPLQGPNMCNFWPTCSQFTRSALNTTGFLPGVLIGGDRLLRCNPFAWSYYDLHYSGTYSGRISDPVENHIAWRQPPPEAGAVIAGGPTASPPPATGAELPSLRFADYLFGNGEYRQSVAEYLRVRFSDRRGPVRDYAGLMAGEALLKSGDLAEARRAFNDVRFPDLVDFSLYGSARAFFGEGRFARTRDVLDSVTQGPLYARAQVLAGWSFFKERRFSEGAARFARLAPEAADLSRMDGRDIRRRSRLLGSVLSAVMPGAGQLYSGRAGDAAYSFLAVAGPGLATWWFAADPARRDRTRVKVSIFGAVTAFFHAANVYGANLAARDYGLAQERRYLARAESLLARVRLEPDYGSLLDTLAATGDSANGR
jgi:putative membrane protein insertion efficiency factor